MEVSEAVEATRGMHLFVVTGTGAGKTATLILFIVWIS